jgi:hemoglobin-like flavoprotein
MSLQVELLESSFSQLKNKETEFTTYFYTNLLADFPEVQPLFAHTDIAKQSEKLFQSLVLVVENLRNPDVLTTALKGLGTRHVKYGALPNHYPMVGSTLLKSFESSLGDAWTADVEKAWTEAYTAVTALMLDGAAYPAEILIPKSASSD